MRKLYFLFFAVLFHLISFSQSISIGSGTVTSGQSPWYPFYGYSYVQTLYKSSEINASGNITSITFDFAGSTLTNSENIVIYLGNTTKNSFSSTTDWIPTSSMTEVFNGTLTGYSAPGPITITFTTPFAYSGTDNLVIAIDENKAGYDGSTGFKATTVAGSARVIYYRNDVTNPDPLNPPAGNAVSNTFANILIDGLTPAACQAATGLDVTNVTATTATATWVAPTLGNAPTGYDWEVRTSGLPSSGSTGLAASGNSVTTDANIIGLISATKDTLYVRTICGTGVYGPWSNGFGFSTLCGATNLPYSIDFEGSTNFPSCTSVENAGTGNDWIVLSNPGSGFTSNTLRYTYNSANAADTWFFTQGLNLTAGVSYRLAFRYGNNSTTYIESLEVKYGIDPTSGSMTDLVVDYPSISINGSANSVTDFTPSTSGVYYFGFHAYSIADQFDLFVDDISFVISPTCDFPSAITQANLTTSGNDLFWTPPAVGTPSGYDIFYSINNTAPTSSTTPSVSNVSGTNATLTGLASATKYYFYLRTICGTSGSSGWSPTDSFTTLCNPVNTLSENFDGVTAPVLPACWSKILRGATLPSAANITTLITVGNVYSSPNAVALYSSSATATDDIILVSPPLTNVGAGTYRLTFYAKNSTPAQDIEVGTLDNSTSTATFTPLQTVDLSTTFQKYTVDFSTYSGTDQFIGIRSLNASSFSYVYIDNVMWELIPSCVEPTKLGVSNITSNSVQIDWLAPTTGTPSAYDLYYNTSNVAPFSSTTPTVASITGITQNVTGLSPTTKYYYYLRTVCGAAGSSPWTAVDSFSTACLAINSFNENFDGVSTPNLPSCWAKLLRGNTLSTAAAITTTLTIANVFSTPNSVSLYNSSSTATDDIILVSPPLSNVGTGTYQLTFYARNSTVAQDIEVGTLDNTSPTTATFTPLQTVDISTTFQKYSVDFSTYTGTDQYIGIRAVNASTFSYVYLDNIVWELIPICVEPSAILVSNITTNSAQLDWTAPTSGSPASYDVYYSLTNTAPTASTTPLISGVTGTMANLTGLSSSSLYYVWVRSNCGASGMSSWTVAYTFATACGVVTAPTVAPETFVSAVIPPSCWSRARGILASPTTFTSITTSNWVLDDYLNVTTPINKCIKINIYGTGRNDWLITPSYDLGTGGNLQLEFDLGLTVWNNTTTTTLGVDDKFYVVISTDNGVTWDSVNTIRRWDATTPISNTGEHITIPLSSYIGTVVFGFYGESTITGNGDNDLFVDNVELKTQIIFPVELISFVGDRKNNHNQLSWITASEQSNKGFEIQRSFDGINFSFIGFASSNANNGNSSSILNYRFTDEKSPSTTTYYRLKQINIDGRSKMSNTVTIKGTRTDEITFSSVYPNPVKRNLNIVISASQTENITLVVSDLAGKVLLRKTTNVVNGENQISLNVETLTAGMYIIKSVCANGCENAVQKFVKQ